MELLQLRYFLALAEKQNLTKTADQLLISPSSLSLTISKLEKELGVQLFTRSGRKIRLNSCGETFYNCVQSGIAEIDLGVAQIRGDATVSVITDSPSVWLGVFSEFMSAETDIMINNRVVRRSKFTQDMLLEKYDFLLSSMSVSGDYTHLHRRELAGCDLWLTVPCDSPLARNETVSLRDLKDEKFLFPSPGYLYYDMYWDACVNAGFEPQIAATCDFLARMKMVSSGQGISFVDANTAGTDIFKKVAFVKLSDVSAFHPIAIYWHKDRVLSAAAESFLQFVGLYFQDNKDM